MQEGSKLAVKEARVKQTLGEEGRKRRKEERRDGERERDREGRRQEAGREEGRQREP